MERKNRRKEDLECWWRVGRVLTAILKREVRKTSLERENLV